MNNNAVIDQLNIMEERRFDLLMQQLRTRNRKIFSKLYLFAILLVGIPWLFSLTPLERWSMTGFAILLCIGATVGIWANRKKEGKQ